MLKIVADIPSGGLLDFVAAWYVKAAEYMNPRHSRARENPEPDAQHPDFRAGANDGTRGAFVSTNSICQGEQVGALWGWLLARGIRIHRPPHLRSTAWWMRPMCRAAAKN
ncbi:MAG: DNA methyltransferase, partial [Porticoccaceae bacterium]